MAPEARGEAAPVYRDASAPVEARVRDLLGRMTLREKAAQMAQIERTLTDLRAGSVLNAGGSTPRDRASPADWATVVDGMQRLALSSRLGVPIPRGGAPGWASAAASPLLAPLLLQSCVSLSLHQPPAVLARRRSGAARPRRCPQPRSGLHGARRPAQALEPLPRPAVLGRAPPLAAVLGERPLPWRGGAHHHGARFLRRLSSRTLFCVLTDVGPKMGSLNGSSVGW